MSTKIHQLQFSLENGKQTLPYTNAEKAKILIVYIFSISCLDETDARLPEFKFACNNFIYDNCISEQNVIDIISITQVNKALGQNNLSHKMLKILCIQ